MKMDIETKLAIIIVLLIIIPVLLLIYADSKITTAEENFCTSYNGSYQRISLCYILNDTTNILEEYKLIKFNDEYKLARSCSP